MTSAWEARIEFTTEIPTRAATIYYGVYDPDALLPWPRFCAYEKEDLKDKNTKHVININLGQLKKENVDIANLSKKSGGVIVYRLEIYSPGTRNQEIPAARFYDFRFEFYKGKRVPTVIEGPFIDLVTPTSAVISWDTDKPAIGKVNVENAGPFKTSPEKATHFEIPLKNLKPGTTYTYSVQLSNGTAATSTRKYYFRTPALNAKKFNFAVIGDSREGLGGGEYQFNGVNATVLRGITTNAFNRGAEFIIHTGDLINGYSSDPLDFKMQLESYKDVIENVGHYIPMYEMMGNHEVVMRWYKNDVPSPIYGDMLMMDKQGDESAEVIFGKEFVNPANGPLPDNKAANVPAGKSKPPYKENVYFFDYGNCRFVTLNSNYWFCGLPEKYGGNLEGYIMDDQMEWLLDVFKKTKQDDSIEHLFIYTQEPLFPVGFQSKTGMWYSGGSPQKNSGYDRTYIVKRRDEIWRAFIDTGKAVLGQFGDEHNYSRTLITKDHEGRAFKQPVWQIISGGAGAPFANRERGLPWDEGVKKTSAQYHYTFFIVEGPKVTLETYNIDGILIDSVELTKNIRK